MLTAFWFHTDSGFGYGATAHSQRLAEEMLHAHGYPVEGERITRVTAGVRTTDLDQNHVLPNAGPIVVNGVWFPRHNL